VRKSKVWTLLLAMILTVGIFGIIHSADATSTYRDRYDTAHGNPSGTTSCTFCHVTTSPVVLNATGQTLLASNFNYCSIGPATGTCAPAVTAPVISSFTANPGSITSGQSSTLSWSLSGGTPTTLTLNGGSVLGLTSQPVSPTTTTLYTLTASNSAGSVSQSVTVTVSAAPQPGSVDLTNWSGQWLKTTIRYDGYYFGQSTSRGSSGDVATPKMDRNYEGIGAYLKFGSWDPKQNVLQGELYQYDTKSNQWVSDPLAFHLIGGTPTDFLVWTQVNGDFTSGFTVRIQGRETGGILTSATFRTLGGYYFETSSDTPVAGKISISGSLVPKSKVPVPK
jgi:hypothetical protein